ncbi:fibronectin type III domain-containing protein [Actinoplanes sp. TFC3]|uniref:fibronectin type III domain-containing protein n=1 Tax=Actinoplanes sp. TFC3 TaxID=1710355 RepID=UPI000831FF34|nr:fibronectin type III domain-containing protein [Actinoplanes sp. TFC3]
MDVRRLLTLVSAGLVGLAATAAGTPMAALAAPAAPKSWNALRGTDDLHKINVTWKAVADADHYVVDFMSGDVETVVNVPATQLSYQIAAPDNCAAYKIRIGSADAAGTSAFTTWSSLKSLGPGYVSGMVTGREDDGNTLTASWKTPASPGYTPVTGYHVVLTRAADKVVLLDKTDADLTFRYPGVDGAKSYNLSVTAINDFGSCLTATSTFQPFRPANPTDLIVQRRADSPGTVEVVWKAATSGPAPTYFQIAYGESKMTGTVKVSASATSGTLKLDTAKAWMIEVKAYNDNGGSGAATGSVPVWTGPDTTTTPAPDPAPSTPADGAAAPDPTQTTTSTTVATGSDRTPPAITTTLSATPKNGYFATPVTIHFTCSDDSGPVAKCPADITAATDGLSQRFSGTAVDAAGNTTTTTLTLSVDQSAPVITATVIGTKNEAGWYTSAPTIRYTCTDNLALAICPADSPIRVDSINQKITGTATDKAGNTATATVLINLDQIAPVIKATVLGEPNGAGWYKDAPTVHFTCTDAGSGIATCPADQVLNGDNAGQKIAGTATDVAGNTATATVTFNLDQTAPVITASVIGTANEAAWFKTAPTIHFTCTDQGSGIASCPEDTVVTTDGAAQAVIGSATDKAGNTATARLTVNVDQSAPVITATVLGDANTAGWYKSAPTVHFECSDSVSGVASCPADLPATTDGAGTLLLGTVVDNAGNTATTSATVSLDQAAPAITATIVGDANADGWFKTAPTVHFTCTDEGSGLAGCPADVTVSTDGAGQRVTGTATDKAGNTASAGVTVNVDLVGPEVTAKVIGEKNAAGWYSAAPTVQFSCTDTGSSVATCPADVTVTGEGTQLSVSGTATDKAGNSTTKTLGVNVDKTAPVITVLGAAKGTVYGAEAAPAVSCRTVEDGSGLATQAVMTHTTDDKGVHTVLCAGAVDNAGNKAAPVSITYTVEPSLAWLIALTHQYLPTASAATLKSLDTAVTRKQFLVYIAGVLLQSIGKKPALTNTQAATLIYWAFVLDRKY